ncbi:MAG: IS630 family transposase [Actinobacteria bacterium]|nr:IS630 family transposase [Actinomycetota bacterium]
MVKVITPIASHHGDQAMQGIITLSAAEHKTLLSWYRHHPDPAVRLRCHILLLLADGYSWAAIVAVLYCSSRTIARWQQRFGTGGLAALTGQPRGPVSALQELWTGVLVAWVLTRTPRAFGYLRSRWCCAVLVLVLAQECQVQVSRETVRRWLHAAGLVWRRPRPTLHRHDPDKEAKLRQLRALLRDLPADETVVWQDEVDLNLNPKIGSMWMRRGQQAEVPTPGDNVKRYLAGSLHWRTGTLLCTQGPARDSDLFVRHLEDLRRRLRRYRVIHVICDNARFHASAAVAAWYGQWYGRVVLHFLPKYAPDLNPIERVWWHLHEEITRNHTCQTIAELVDLTFAWLTARNPFAIEGSAYAD